MKHLVLFDFDGTLVDSVDAIVDAIDEVADLYGYTQALSREQIRSTPLRTLVKNMKIPFWKVPRLIDDAYAKLAPRVPRMKLHPHMLEILDYLKDKAELGIVSGNDPRVIKKFLKHNDLLSYFPTIEGKLIFAKNRRINKIRKSFGIDKSNTLYVGDETRDIHAARRARVNSLAVTWGVNSIEVLMDARPSMIATTGKEAMQLLEAWIESRV